MQQHSQTVVVVVGGIVVVVGGPLVELGGGPLVVDDGAALVVVVHSAGLLRHCPPIVEQASSLVSVRQLPLRQQHSQTLVVVVGGTVVVVGGGVLVLLVGPLVVDGGTVVVVGGGVLVVVVGPQFTISVSPTYVPGSSGPASHSQSATAAQLSVSIAQVVPFQTRTQVPEQTIVVVVGGIVVVVGGALVVVGGGGGPQGPVISSEPGVQGVPPSGQPPQQPGVPGETMLIQGCLTNHTSPAVGCVPHS